MAIELKIPEVGESITQVEIGQWLKREGDSVNKDEGLVTIESDKATVEIPSPASGTLLRILKRERESAAVGEVIAQLEPETKASSRGGLVPASTAAPAAPAAKPKPAEAAATGAAPAKPSPAAATAEPEGAREAPPIMPAAERLLAEHQVPASKVSGTGSKGRVLKEDVLRHLSASPEPERPAATRSAAAGAPAKAGSNAGPTRLVPMTPLRRTVAQRLVQAQQTAALLTTFNEVDMQSVMDLRKQFGEAFLAKHQVKLGFMSFFVKAVVDALQLVPQVNASIENTDIIYHDYIDIGIAIGAAKGLVVPVLRQADQLSLAQIEQKIADFGARARDNKLKLDELHGGTFTISNGGVYGSLLSTPIVNPPQSGILGMHTIQDRPVAWQGNVVIRPMMYLALTYDHRLVDGREAVTFLKRIKETIENPVRLMMGV
jgi:2-oxoglutarate dehydrogenase E2 component (dihydrolipoamide succinyltransferase)